MKNRICKAFFFLEGGWGGIGDREWTIMVLLHAGQGSMLANSDLLYDEFKAKKIVVLEYEYNIMLTILFNINS